MTAQEAVGLRDMHPAQQVRIGCPVGPPVGGDARDMRVDAANPVHRALRVLDSAVRGRRQERAGALQAPPRVFAVVGVLRDGDHRQRVQRLKQQRPEAADEHRGIPVHTADRAVVREPARSGLAEALPVSRTLWPGDPGEKLLADAPLQRVQMSSEWLRHGFAFLVARSVTGNDTRDHRRYAASMCDMRRPRHRHPARRAASTVRARGIAAATASAIASAAHASVTSRACPETAAAVDAPAPGPPADHGVATTTRA